jgi:RNA polymerase sigma-70 factor, ECF subfamily
MPWLYQLAALVRRLQSRCASLALTPHIEINMPISAFTLRHVPTSPVTPERCPDPAAADPAGPADPADNVRALLDHGDRKGAIAALMDTHGKAVFTLCARVLRDRTLAEDVLQQVFLEAHRDIDRFEGRSSFAAWLLGIAGHRCQDALKAQRRRLQRIESDDQTVSRFADPGETPTDRLERIRITAALDECMTALSDEVRMTVLLRFQHGKSYHEMSAQLGAKPTTLHARVARALPVLKRCLECKGWEP